MKIKKLFGLIMALFLLLGCQVKYKKRTAVRKEDEYPKNGSKSSNKRAEGISSGNNKKLSYAQNSRKNSISLLNSIPEYCNKPYTIVNNNIPFFRDSDFSSGLSKSFSALDSLGRCQSAFAVIDNKTMPSGERKPINMIKPTGWHIYRFEAVKKYESTTSFKSRLGYLYNRCHLIAYELCGENANKKNLITGTRYLNVEGMLPFENKTAMHARRTGRKILYRATPVFKSNEMLARGVLLEAASAEDKGKSFHFCIYCYNVQPDIHIDYSDGRAREK